MSLLFGPVRQLGYVVHDLERAVRYWSEKLKVGPFFVIERGAIEDFQYKGEPTDAWLSFAFAQAGSMQIELIQPRDDKPSPYRDFLAAGHEGLQHLGFWTEAFDADLKRALDAGFTVELSGRTIEPTGHIVYFAESAHPGTVIELSSYSPVKRRVFSAIADAAAGWDGTDPIRPIESLIFQTPEVGSGETA